MFTTIITRIFMPIISDMPVTVPATLEKTYDTWWIEKVNIDATLREEGKVVLVIDYKLCYLDENQMPVFHPTADPKQLIIRDFLAYTSQNPDIYNTTWNAVNVLGNIGKTEGIIS
jgi:hypothetical protein